MIYEIRNYHYEPSLMTEYHVLTRTVIIVVLQQR